MPPPLTVGPTISLLRLRSMPLLMELLHTSVHPLQAAATIVSFPHPSSSQAGHDSPPHLPMMPAIIAGIGPRCHCYLHYHRRPDRHPLPLFHRPSLFSLPSSHPATILAGHATHCCIPIFCRPPLPSPWPKTLPPFKLPIFPIWPSFTSAPVISTASSSATSASSTPLSHQPSLHGPPFTAISPSSASTPPCSAQSHHHWLFPPSRPSPISFLTATSLHRSPSIAPFISLCSTKPLIFSRSDHLSPSLQSPASTTPPSSSHVIPHGHPPYQPPPLA